MNVRYQIFVSSTHTDLREERERVIDKLIKSGFIAVGMEQFHAANEEQMDYIRPIIDETDYYIVIVKGRYGSVGDDGVSYTEKEYRYALEKGIPILGFLYENVSDLRVGETDQDSDKQEKLKNFRKELECKRMVSYWRSVESLVSQVTEAVHGAVRRDPRVGWVRGDQAMDVAVFRDLEKARQKITQLEQTIEKITVGDIEFPSHLAQGADIVDINYKVTRENHKGKNEVLKMGVLSISWDDILGVLVAALYREFSESSITNVIAEHILETLEADSNENHISIDRKYIQDIRFQFEALGIMTTFTQTTRSVGFKRIELCWKLTEKGRRYISNLKAARRNT